MTVFNVSKQHVRWRHHCCVKSDVISRCNPWPFTGCNSWHKLSPFIQILCLNCPVYSFVSTTFCLCVILKLPCLRSTWFLLRLGANAASNSAYHGYPELWILRYPAHRYHAVLSPWFEPTTLWLRVVLTIRPRRSRWLDHPRNFIMCTCTSNDDKWHMTCHNR
jgi:hypothetical protein